MSDVFEVFANDVHTAKVPGLGLVDFVRWETVIDKWEQPAIPPDVRETLREALDVDRKILERRAHTVERHGVAGTRYYEHIAAIDAALSWLDKQDGTPFLTAAEFTEQLIDGMRDVLGKLQDGE